MTTDRVRDHFNGEAPHYDDLIVRLIPGYHEQQEALLDALPFPHDATLQTLDLGCGTGALSRLVLEAYPNATVEATDLAPGMLAECEGNLAAFAGRVTFRELDFASGDIGTDYDLVVSGLAIHHISDDGKRALFARVFDALAPGGVFVMRDKVLADTPEEIASDLEAWRTFMSAAGEDAERWVMQACDEDMPATLTAQLRWLREAGFSDVTCYWRDAGFAVYGGGKP